jgi:hypothetical protein
LRGQGISPPATSRVERRQAGLSRGGGGRWTCTLRQRAIQGLRGRAPARELTPPWPCFRSFHTMQWCNPTPACWCQPPAEGHWRGGRWRSVTLEAQMARTPKRALAHHCATDECCPAHMGMRQWVPRSGPPSIAHKAARGEKHCRLYPQSTQLRRSEVLRALRCQGTRVWRGAGHEWGYSSLEESLSHVVTEALSRSDASGGVVEGTSAASSGSGSGSAMDGCRVQMGHGMALRG